MILPSTDNSRLLGDKIVAMNDYGVNISGKVKTFHINMQRKRMSRVTDKDEDTTIASAIFDIVDASTIDQGDEEELVEMIPNVGKEVSDDVRIMSKLD